MHTALFRQQCVWFWKTFPKDIWYFLKACFNSKGIHKDDLISFFKTNKPLGVDRVVPIGTTLDFSLNWDGYDLINQMSRIIQIN